MYLTYAEYKAYGGTLDETTFNDVAFEAASLIDWYTFNRLQNDTEYPEAVKRCMYSIIKYVIAQQQVSGIASDNANNSGVNAGIVSHSNDGVSESFNILSAKDVIDAGKSQIKQLVNQYLSSVVNSLGQKVLYRGVYPNE